MRIFTNETVYCHLGPTSTSGVVALLEEMTRRMKVTLNDARILASDPQHQAAKRCVTDLHEQVHVIGHQAVRVKSSRESFDDFCDEFVEHLSIRRREEDVLAVIATQCYGVERAGNVKSERPRHPASRAAKFALHCRHDG